MKLLTGMRFRLMSLIIVVLGLATNACAFAFSRHASETLIQELFEKTAASQHQEDVPFVQLKSWFAQKGIYDSDIKLNFYGKLDLAEMRRAMNIKDNNMFVTAWVTSSLLESTRYGQAPRPSDSQLSMALDAIYAHRDLNKAYNTSTYAFWQQRYNKTLQYYDSSPVNLLGAFDMLDQVPMDALSAILSKFGLQDIAKVLESILRMQSGYTNAFKIPPDFDDTFVNVGLGSLLYELRDAFPAAWDKWNKNNNNLTSALVALEKYAYRPFSSDNNTNFIDPRTYYYIRPYLNKAVEAGQDVALVTTWIQNLEDLRTEYYKGVKMPFQCNNVDVTVAANTVFGLTSSILAGLIKPSVLDGEIGKIYLNTSSLIAYEITTNLSNRADLALLYYPSKFEFFWFVARTVDLMETYLMTQPLPHPALQTVYYSLKLTLLGPMTETILSKARTDILKATYFDDFLGDGDLTHDNRTFKRAEDRIFTTAMAANALMYTWTRFDTKTKSCQWRDGIPDKVRGTILGAVAWLVENTLSGDYDPWNAFFSGSVKGGTTLPYYYPANMFEYLNGTTIDNPESVHSFNSSPFIKAVRGHVDEVTYQKLLQQKHNGQSTPQTFHGYNTVKGFFPLWSSEPYTYSTTLLALSRFNSIV